MHDFADVPNSSGSFPSVVAQDCSGPGETDGTAHIAETVTDYWGWMQALLNDQSMTPNDTTESSSASQILDALKKLIMIVAGPRFLSAGDYISEETSGAYEWSLDAPNMRWASAANDGRIIAPVKLPMDLSSHTVNVQVRVQPGAARSTGNRIEVKLYRIEFTSGNVTALSTVEDDGTTDLQTIEVSSSITSNSDYGYGIMIQAGNSGATQTDYLYSAKIEIEDYPN